MRIITVTDPSFLRGTITLVSSIIRNSRLEAPSFVVLHENLDEEQRSRIERLGAPVEFLDAHAIARFDVPENSLPDYKRRRLKKLGIFAALPGERLCYLDSDMLCVGDLREIETFEHFSAAMDLGYGPPKSVHGYPMFNSGFMVFRSSAEFHAELQDFASADHFAQKADQFLLNDFFHRSGRPVRIVHPGYNIAPSVRYAHPVFYKGIEKAGIRLLHYTNMKPWAVRRPNSLKRSEVKHWLSMLRSTREYRLWHEEERRAGERIRSGGD